jgi:hypothetical protein
MITMANSDIGKEVEAYCGKCKTNTVHRITKMDETEVSKVICQTCNAEHKFRAPKKEKGEADNATKATKTKKAAKDATKKAPVKKRRITRRSMNWDTVMEKLEGEVPVSYSLTGNFESGVLLDHKKFGIGYIQDVGSETKITVLFEEGVKTLVQNWVQQ